MASQTPGTAPAQAPEKDFVLVKYEHDRDHEIALNEFTHNLEMEQLRLLILLNGGAATALLTFAEHSSATPFLMIAVGIWLVGLSIGAAATFIMRKVQSDYSKFYRHQRNATEFKRFPDPSILPPAISSEELAKLQALVPSDSEVKDAIERKVYAVLHDRLAPLAVADARKDNDWVRRLSYLSLAAFVLGAVVAAYFIITKPGPQDHANRTDARASAPAR